MAKKNLTSKTKKAGAKKAAQKTVAKKTVKKTGSKAAKKKASSKKPTIKKAVAKKPVKKKAAKKKSTTKKVVAKKIQKAKTAKKKTSKATTKKFEGKKSPAKKSPVKKSVAKKPIGKKRTVKKTVAVKNKVNTTKNKPVNKNNIALKTAESKSTNILLLSHNTGSVFCTVTPPSSKSESNRVLIINALAGGTAALHNLSNARDTQTMIKLLKSKDNVLDVLDAGTTMRFLTAYCAVTGKEVVLTGTQRMQERPIALLVDALRKLGAEIEYEKKEGYPPIKIKKISKTDIETNRISIRGDVSSQYISALLMVAPMFPNGLTLELTGKVGSKPYIRMTLDLLKHFGIFSEWNDNIIEINHQEFIPAEYTVESDWSAASYWYSIVALAKEAKVTIKGYRTESLQGDSVVAEIMKNLGVKTTYENNTLILEKTDVLQSFEWDFTDCPDLAQTIAVVAAAKGVECTLSGLESLRIKETDRIAALQNELKKFGAEMIELEKDTTYKIVKSDFSVNEQIVETYKDHRMAMAFAPLALLGSVNIKNPDVVEKSYPHFWEDLNVAGFEIEKK
ncbi:MAG: 3-phosphoshikimate 1-carboxyvinyltransferase [Cytophagaceae bacterium]